MRTANKLIIAKEKSDDIFKSLEFVMDNVERQIKRYKEKQREHKNNKMADSLVAE